MGQGAHAAPISDDNSDVCVGLKKDVSWGIVLAPSGGVVFDVCLSRANDGARHPIRDDADSDACKAEPVSNEGTCNASSDADEDRGDGENIGIGWEDVQLVTPSRHCMI